MKDDVEIIQGLQVGNMLAFRALVLKYSGDMLIMAYMLSNDQEKAAVIVEKILMGIWDGTLTKRLPTPLGPFLMGSVRMIACLEILSQLS
jgi:hypothetical protein